MIGIIQGIISNPLTGLAKENLRLKNKASRKPIINWNTRHSTVNSRVLIMEVRKTSSWNRV